VASVRIQHREDEKESISRLRVDQMPKKLLVLLCGSLLRPSPKYFEYGRTMYDYIRIRVKAR
jgi:hypothetical protein